MTQKSLTDIEQLVYKSKFMHEFNEEALQQSLDPIFDKPALLSAQYFNETKRLLYLISGIDKSSNFGYYFYEKMQDNPYPFCEEVLQSATYTENYYNLHDKALKSYVRSYMINSIVSPGDILFYDKVIPEGHGIHFFDALKVIRKKNIRISSPVAPLFFKTLFYVLNNDNFPMSQKKAACIMAYLNLETMIPAMIGKSIFLINSENLSADNMMVILHYLTSVSIIQSQELPDNIYRHIEKLLKLKDNSFMLEYFNRTGTAFIQYLAEQDSSLYTAE